MSPAEARLKGSPVRHDRCRVEPARQSRRRLPPGRAVWLGRPGRHHISARVPGPEHHFLINPYGLMFDEITASSLVKVRSRRQPAYPERLQHQPGRLHHPFGDPRACARTPAACFICTPPTAQRVASCMEGLLPMNQTAQLVTHDLAITTMKASPLDHDEASALQQDLGNKNHMLLRNHGTLTVGRFGRLRLRAHVPSGAGLHDAGAYPHARPHRLSGRSGRGRQECAIVRQSRPRRNALDQLVWPPLFAQTPTASTPATGIESFEFWCRIAVNNLCTTDSKRRPIPGGVFIWRAPTSCVPIRISNSRTISVLRPSLRAQQAIHLSRLLRHGLLRCARNDARQDPHVFAVRLSHVRLLQRPPTTVQRP